MPLLQELAQAHAGGAGDQHAQDVGAAVVEPLLARLVQQRQPPKRCINSSGGIEAWHGPGATPRLAIAFWIG